MNLRSRELDRLSTRQIVRLMNAEDRRVLQAVRKAAPGIARAAQEIAQALRDGGRLILVGAGTSGRLAVMEAAECPPTFNTLPGQVVALMAGGRPAVFRSKEGAEDSEAAARQACRRLSLARSDVMVGVAASGVTPFVRAALAAARQRKARTLLVTCNPLALDAPADRRIALDTGPEILTGSTRLKAGTACKMALNMLTTASMVLLGKTYGHYMVDLQPKSRKLVARGLRLIRRLGGVSDAEARRLFERAGGRVKLAILMGKKRLGPAQARAVLESAGGRLRAALDKEA